MAPERFSGATHKETLCFAAECGPDPFGHTRALRGPFFSELGWELSSVGFRVVNNSFRGPFFSELGRELSSDSCRSPMV